MSRSRRRKRRHPSESEVPLRPALIFLGAAIALWFFLARPPDPFPIPTPVMPMLTSLPPGEVTRVVPRDPEHARPTAGRATTAHVRGEVVFGEDFDRWRLLQGVQADPTAYPPGRFSVPVGASGVLLLPDTEPGRPDEVRVPTVLVQDIAWSASATAYLEVQSILLRGGYARVYFRTREDGDEFPADQFFELPTHPASTAQDLVFPTAGHPGWKGVVTGLRLELLSTPWALWLGSVRALDYDLVPGVSPAIDGDGEWQDAGLVLLRRELADDPRRARHEARRAHPSVGGESQYVLFRSEDPLQLDFAFAPMPGAALEGRVEFEVYRGVLDARGKTWEAPPQRISVSSAHARYDADRWQNASVSLPPVEGNNVLIFRTQGGAADGAWNGLWGGVQLTNVRRRASSLLLVTVESLRADHVGAYGAPSTRTPNLDALAQRGVRFADCLTASNLTVPSHASIFTGVYPKDHGLSTNRERLPEAATTLAELMAAGGRATIACSAVRHLNGGHSGLAQGFDVYLDTPPAIRGGDVPSDARRPGYRTAGVVNEQLLECLDELGERPFFAWAHYHDPHTPYEPEPGTRLRPRGTGASGPADEPIVDRLIRRRCELDPGFALGPDGRRLSPAELRERFAERYPDLRFLREESDPEMIRAAYRAEIEELDRDLGRLLGWLEQNERLEDTLVVVVADHGEALGERDVWFRHDGLHDETLRVPLIMAGPELPAETVSELPASTVDLVPTLVDYFELESRELYRGRSLLPVAEVTEEERVRRRWFQHGHGVQVGFRDPYWHCVYFRKKHERNVVGLIGERRGLELYSIPKDPELTLDLAGRSPERDARLVGEIEAWSADHIAFGDVEASDLDDEVGMGMLGYVDPADE